MASVDTKTISNSRNTTNQKSVTSTTTSKIYSLKLNTNAVETNGEKHNESKSNDNCFEIIKQSDARFVKTLE